jgi:hypothetical protein
VSGYFASKVVFPSDFAWAAESPERILAEWPKRYPT